MEDIGNLTGASARLTSAAAPASKLGSSKNQSSEGFIPTVQCLPPPFLLDRPSLTTYDAGSCNGLYPPIILPDYGGGLFTHSKETMLRQLDFHDKDNILIPLDRWYDKL